MNNPMEIPTAEQARRAADKVLADALDDGSRPSVLAVARQLGLSNTTFRRNFPQLAHELSQARRTPPSRPDKPSPATVEQTRLAARNAKLRRDNRQLREQLNIAVANIRYLALTVHKMQTELEAASNITRIDNKTRVRQTEVE